MKLTRFLSREDYAAMNAECIAKGWYHEDVRMFTPGMGWYQPWYFDPEGRADYQMIKAKGELGFLSVHYWNHWADTRPPICIVCPNYEHWEIDRKSGNGTGWTVTGAWPNLTCSPSIVVTGYHRVPSRWRVHGGSRWARSHRHDPSRSQPGATGALLIMWTTILSFLGALLPGIFGQAIDGVVTIEQAKISATTAATTLAEDQTVHEIAADSSVAATNAQVVIAEQAHWFTRSIRPLIAFPFIVWIWSCVADKTVLTWLHINHSTDDLGPTLHWVCMLALTSYLGPIAYSALRKS